MERVETILYKIHIYVRYKLVKTYPGKVSETDYIEAHLLAICGRKTG